jgi:DNA-binding SARP family transcriptional activator
MQRINLCQMFWEVPDDPRASLRWSLSKLRQIINQNGDGDCLKADRESVHFDTARLDVDLPQVDHMTADDVRCLDISRLETLAAAFRGRFLEGLELPRSPAFEAWRIFHGDALDRTRSMILRALVERLRSEPGRALLYAQTLRTHLVSTANSPILRATRGHHSPR